MTIARHHHRSIIWWYYLIDITIPKLSLVFTFDASWYHWLSFPLCKRLWLIETSERLYSSSNKINLFTCGKWNLGIQKALFKHVGLLFQIGVCLILFSPFWFSCLQDSFFVLCFMHVYYYYYYYYYYFDRRYKVLQLQISCYCAMDLCLLFSFLLICVSFSSLQLQTCNYHISSFASVIPSLHHE